jgi:uncharacterized protein YkwD
MGSFAGSPQEPGRTVRRFSSRIFFVLTFAVLLTYAILLAKPQASTPERALFEAANRERSAHGLQPLRWDNALATAARQHALVMRQHNELSHQFPGEPSLQDRASHAGARYSVIAENVAEGPDAASIQSGWMHSPPHRANLLDPTVNSVGIAVVPSSSARDAGGRTHGSGARGMPNENDRSDRNGNRGDAGVLFAVEDFSRAVVSLSYEEQEKEVRVLLKSKGLRVIDAKQDARKTCETDRGFTGPSATVVRYETSDLSQFPNGVDKAIREGHFQSAAVGACKTGDANAFTQFRIALLLYR